MSASGKGVQHLLRQTLLRRNQLAKRNRLADLKKYKKERFDYYQGILQRDREYRKSVKNERITRREDWIKGPLAPRRDVGQSQGVYGTAAETLARPVDLPKRLRPKDEDVNIVAGDRVVVIKGAGRGHIGEVRDVSKDSMTCSVAGIRIVDFAIPSYHPMAKQSDTKYNPQPLPIPLSEVRLVTPLTDDVTGITKDVVVRHISTGEPKIERSAFSNLPEHTRYIAGTEIPIPWPKEEMAEPQAEEGDTRRRDVDEPSYVPSITAEHIMPEGVIDELRNPYSRTRTMHDEAFLKEKLLIDMRRTWEIERATKGMTPKEEYWAQKEKERQARRPSGRAVRPSRETMDILCKEMRGVRL